MTAHRFRPLSTLSQSSTPTLIESTDMSCAGYNDAHRRMASRISPRRRFSDSERSLVIISLGMGPRHYTASLEDDESCFADDENEGGNSGFGTRTRKRRGGCSVVEGKRAGKNRTRPRRVCKSQSQSGILDHRRGVSGATK